MQDSTVTIFRLLLFLSIHKSIPSVNNKYHNSDIIMLLFVYILCIYFTIFFIPEPYISAKIHTGFHRICLFFNFLIFFK